MQIPLGVEMMIKSVIKMIGLDPVKVMNSIDGIHNALQSSASDLRDIRENQKILMEHFGLEQWHDRGTETNGGTVVGQIGGNGNAAHFGNGNAAHFGTGT